MQIRQLVTLTLAGTIASPLLFATTTAAPRGQFDPWGGQPIQHLVVIFDENVSFDHYFGTYPHAMNPAGEPRFEAATDTPTANTPVGALLNTNPNLLNAANGTDASNPFRLDRSQAATADQDHDYGPEQMAFDHGLMDLFPKSVGVAGPPPPGAGPWSTKGLTMGYYDGNTVTALWNYAQHFAMSDNSYGTNFGPSTVGALNLVSGQTNGVDKTLNGQGEEVADGNGGLTVIGDPDPLGDLCSNSMGNQVSMLGQNIGDLLNDAGITWGWFQGGFDLTAKNADGSTGCNRSSKSLVTGMNQADYVPHHEPFQYYKSTANLSHLRPTSTAAIGRTDRANHQYDINDFFTAVSNGHFPAVNFLKPPKFQNGHAGNSDPLDEQTFIVTVVNFLESRPEWANTAVIIAYDDSDGWYDHQMSPIVNQSATILDALSGTGACGSGSAALPGVKAESAQGRCGYGPRLPLLVISPWARQNFIDHTVTDQTSIIRFIEDNWLGGHRVGQGSFDAASHSIRNMFDFTRARYGDDGKLFLSTQTGEPASGRPF